MVVPSKAADRHRSPQWPTAVSNLHPGKALPEEEGVAGFTHELTREVRYPLRRELNDRASGLWPETI